MEGSSSHASDDYDDEGGLELSLGLSVHGTKGSRKGLEGSMAPAHVGDDGSSPDGGAGESVPAGGKLPTSNHNSKYVRGCGLDAALKKFLAGRLDEQDEPGKLLDGYSSQQDPANRQRQMLDGYPSHLEEGTSAWELCTNNPPLEDRSDSASPGTGNANLLAGTPLTLQFMEASKNGSASSPLGSMGGADGRPDGDIGEVQSPPSMSLAPTTSDALEQHKKWQEARKKRKCLIEEQKQLKKFKKEEERTVPHGFRRPGSNSWVRGLDTCASTLDAERAFMALPETGESEQVQEEIRQIEGDNLVREKGSEELDKAAVALGDNEQGVEVNFMPQLKPCVAAVRDNNATREHDAPGLSSNHQEGELSALSCQKVGSPSQSSSTESGISERKEAQSCGGDGEVSSAPPRSTESDAMVAPVSTRVLTPAAALSNGFPPPTSISAMPVPYSVPVSIPNMAGVPIPAGFTFPYMMPYAASTVEGQEQNSFRPSTFQSPIGEGYPSFQVGSSEGTTPWLQLMRPPVGLHIGNTVEQENDKAQAKVLESGSGHSPVTGTGHSLYRNGVIGSAQDSTGMIPLSRQAPDLKFVSSLSLTQGASPFRPLGVLENHADPHSMKEQASGFTASSAQVGQSVGGLQKHHYSTEEVAGKQEHSRAGYGEMSTLHQGARIEEANAAHQNDACQEEFGCTLGGQQFHRGTTENLLSSEGFSQELAGLWPGIPAGLKFGGTGSTPELPWVSTTGPNGKMVSGVLYKINKNQLRVVCACHGRHMSTGEFLQHAGNGDGSIPDKSGTANGYPLTGQPS